MTAVLVTAPVAGASGAEKNVERIADAVRVIEEGRATPDRAVPDAVWRNAECVAVFPGLKKGAFIIGGEYGKGVVSCRGAQGWSAPAFLTLEKASWGAQVGAQSVDLMLFFMNRRGVERLLANNVTLGADASVAAGPVGRSGSAGTDLQLTAEVLSYSRARGAFAGIDISGGVMRPDDSEDQKLYGRAMSAQEILLQGGVRPPAAARPLVSALNSISREVAANNHAPR
jgi:lipid-binding SYLF domain-containing protein